MTSNAASAKTYARDSKQSRVLLRFVETIRPKRKRTADEWADLERRLPAGSEEGDRYRSSRTPYLVPFMRAPQRRGSKRLILVAPSQSGKSNALFNVIGHRLEDEPVPILYVAPTRNLVLTVVEPKIDDMLRNSPVLWDGTLKGKKYTRTIKRVFGVPLRLAWGGSTTELKGDTAFFAFVDELEEFDRDIGGQGGALELADARHAAYENGMTITASTPTEGNIEIYEHPITGLMHWKIAESESVISQIWRAWQSGTRHEWAWPCPHCREYFIPRFERLKFDSKSSQREIELNAHVECQNCKAAIHSVAKSWCNQYGVMIAPGQYVYSLTDENIAGEYVNMVDAYAAEQVPEREDDRVFRLRLGDFAMPSEVETTDVSMWYSGLAHWALARTFGSIAWMFLRAHRSGEPSAPKGVINTVLGECFKFGGDAPKLEEIETRRAAYKTGQVADEITQVLFAADVQEDRIPWVVRGFSERGESWLIEYGEVWGETRDLATFRQLGPIIEKKYAGHNVRAGAIDSGFRTIQVYDYCRERLGVLVPTKGHDTLDRHFYPKRIDVRPDGKADAYSLTLWHINTDVAKSWVHSRMVISEADAGAWHLPQDVTDYYMRQIVAEQRMVKPSGRVAWKKTGRNDFLDCEALIWFLYRVLGPVKASKARPSPELPGTTSQISRGIEV